MKKPLPGSFALQFVASFAMIQGRMTKKEPPNSNYDSDHRSESLNIAVSTITAINDNIFL